ncbi:hypothetical protein [Terrabacter sp. 2RAF25]|uniref:hypothetical protein n=1 Tax=Terrabacter sp. 2RAF25 TaxID=3232998 RepID=UPI003F95BAD9
MRSDVIVRDRTRLRWLAVVPMPLVVAGLVLVGHVLPQPDSGSSARLSFGPVSAQVVALPMPPASQMMMPMAESGDHGDELQVVLRIGNDTDAPVTVPFARVHLEGADGAAVAPSQGLQGDLLLRPHATAEERLHFTDPASATVRVVVPDGSDDRVLTVAVSR